MPDPNCQICDGTGWRQVELGEVTAAERCSCSQGPRPGQRLEAARLPARFAHATFDNFRIPRREDNPLGNEALSKAMLEARLYAREYPTTEKAGLLFMGFPGVGKTHLATAVLQLLTERGFECLFLDYQALLDRIRQGYDKATNASAREAYEEALDTEVVLLDDLGAHRVTDWVEDTVTAIINHRYNGRKATIVTTNLPDPDLGDVIFEKNQGLGRYNVKDSLADRVGARARSRLFEMCKLVRITATEDYRLRGVR